VPPGRRDPVEKGQIIRDIHVSGKVLGKQKYLTQVARYNARVEALVKEGKPHNLPIVLEKRKVVEDGKTVEREFYTCESCHTVHWERGRPATRARRSGTAPNCVRGVTRDGGETARPGCNCRPLKR